MIELTSWMYFSLSSFFQATSLARFRYSSGMEVTEGEVFELRLDPVNPQAVGQGGIDVQGLLGDFDLASPAADTPGCACCGAGRPA